MKHYYIHIGGEGSQQNFRKSDWGGVNIKLKVTSFLDGPLFRPRAKNGGFQLVIYKDGGRRDKTVLQGYIMSVTRLFLRNWNYDVSVI